VRIEDTAEEDVGPDTYEVVDVAQEEPDMVDPLPAHPRIWLTEVFLETLRDRQERSTPNAVVIRDWCRDHGEDDLDLYVDEAGTGMLTAVNYALLYQLQGAPTYAQRAMQIVEHGLANPPAGHTVDDWIEADDWAAAANLLPAVALVLDWCWDWMSESRRTALADRLAQWSSRIQAAEPPGWQDPSTHTYHGLTWALLAAGYATWGHHPGAEDLIALARDVMLEEGLAYAAGEELSWPVHGSSTGRANGGMWPAGTTLGNLSTIHLLSAVHAARSAEGLTFPDLTFPDEVVDFNIHATAPDGSRTHAEGDAALGIMGASLRVAVLLAVSLSDLAKARHGQHWLDTHSAAVGPSASHRLHAEFIWYDDMLDTEDYTTVVGDHWFARGAQVLFWRSGWTSTDLWAAMRVGVLGTDHAHNGLGHLEIWSGGDPLVADRSALESDPTLHQDLAHSVLYVPPADEGAEPRFLEGASVVEHYVANPAYIYLAGDMTPVYEALGTESTVAHKERELFLVVQESTLAVMDRATSVEADTDKVFQLWTAAEATASGTDHLLSTTGADLWIHTAHPAGAVATVETVDSPRIRVATADVSVDRTFLHLLRAVDPGNPSGVFEVTPSVDEVAAAGFTGESADNLVIFSTDPEGDPHTAASYTLTFDHASALVRVFMLDMEPGATYYTEHLLTEPTVVLTVADTDPGAGSARTSSTEGILSFEFTLE
jgi:hypothetical protein